MARMDAFTKKMNEISLYEARLDHYAIRELRVRDPRRRDLLSVQPDGWTQ